MNNGICGICGKPMMSNSTQDHIYPKAILKWTPYSTDALRKLINAPENIIMAHELCNTRKQDSIIQTDKVIMSGKQRETLKKLAERAQPEIDEFLRQKEALLKKQGGRCFGCGEKIDSGSIRRIDPSQARTWSNGCVVCSRCNIRKGGFFQNSITLKQAQLICSEIEQKYAKPMNPVSHRKPNVPWTEVYETEEDLICALRKIYVPMDKSQTAPPSTFRGFAYIYSFARWVQEGKTTLLDGQLKKAKQLAVEIKKAESIADYHF